MRKSLLLITSFFLLIRCGGENSGIEKEQSTSADISTYTEQELYEYIIFLEDNLLDTNNNSLVPNRENSIKLLESSNNFVERFPENKEKKNILYKGVRAARGLEKYHEAVRLLDKILALYPEDEQVVELLFEKAFIYDENLKNTEEAKRIYTKIAAEYPEHQFGQDSKSRLITIDMTEEEFMNWLTKQNAQ